jgi:hypothetical protein
MAKAFCIIWLMAAGSANGAQCLAISGNGWRQWRRIWRQHQLALAGINTDNQRRMWRIMWRNENQPEMAAIIAAKAYQRKQCLAHHEESGYEISEMSAMWRHEMAQLSKRRKEIMA